MGPRVVEVDTCCQGIKCSPVELRQAVYSSCGHFLSLKFQTLLSVNVTDCQQAQDKSKHQKADLFSPLSIAYCPQGTV